MKKLTLDINALTVTSFEAAQEMAQEFGPTRANTCQTCETNCLPYC